MNSHKARLDMPPIDEAYAMPNNRDISKFLEFFLEIFGRLSLIFEQIAKQIGSNISVVEVFITHILIKKEIHINAPTIADAELLIDAMTLSANLLWSPDAWIATAKIKPPKNKKMLGLAYAAAAALKSIIPNNGNKASGRRDVTGSGIASVPHQLAINSATAAISHAWSEIDWGELLSDTAKKRIIPNQKPNFL